MKTDAIKDVRQLKLIKNSFEKLQFLLGSFNGISTNFYHSGICHADLYNETIFGASQSKIKV
jgi:hypothetical protein